MYLLALDTATDVCSVAVFKDDQAQALLALNRPRAHAEQLLPLVRDALHYAGIDLGRLKAVAVSEGPGSYTGLRIGVSTAKGLALALKVALIAVPTLEALAASALPYASPDSVLGPVMPARRDEVYGALYRVEQGGKLALLSEAEAIKMDEISKWAAKAEGSEIQLIGTAAGKLRTLLGQSDPGTFEKAALANSGLWIGRQALIRWVRGEVEDPVSFEPHYIKSFVTTQRKGTPFDKRYH